MLGHEALMSQLEENSREITAALAGRARILGNVSSSSKIAAVFGAFVAIISKLSLSGDASTVGQTLGAALVFIAGILIWAVEDNASKLLAKARLALDEALSQNRASEAQERQFAELEQINDDEQKRLSHLQAAREWIREIFEKVALASDPPNEVAVIDKILQTAKHSLFMAHGFEMDDMHTICVYKRMVADGTGKIELRCVSHIRELDCPIKEARIWPEGIGAAGSALARQDEVVVPDLHDPALGTLLGLPEKKADDDERYGSIVAEPIWATDRAAEIEAKKRPTEPWGIVCATSKIPGHFSLEDRSYVEVTKTLAGMLSLAVKLVRAKQSSAVSVPGK
jgi:hypothetical protein